MDTREFNKHYDAADKVFARVMPDMTHEGFQRALAGLQDTAGDPMVVFKEDPHGVATWACYIAWMAGVSLRHSEEG